MQPQKQGWSLSHLYQVSTHKRPSGLCPFCAERGPGLSRAWEELQKRAEALGKSCQCLYGCPRAVQDGIPQTAGCTKQGTAPLGPSLPGESSSSVSTDTKKKLRQGRNRAALEVLRAQGSPSRLHGATKANKAINGATCHPLTKA